MQAARRLLTLWEAQIVDVVHHLTLFHLHPAGFARRVLFTPDCPMQKGGRHDLSL